MKYRQKPAVIDAERVDKLLYWFKYEYDNLPAWFDDAYDSGGVVCAEHRMSIETPAGRRIGTPDHMVLGDAAGNLTILRIEIFEIIYEEAGQ